MSLLVLLYIAILFFVLTPGILLTVPRKGSKYVVAAVHSLVFALVYYFTHKLVWRIEGMSYCKKNNADSRNCAGGYWYPNFNVCKYSISKKECEKRDHKDWVWDP